MRERAHTHDAPGPTGEQVQTNEEGFLMSVKQCIILHCCFLLLVLTGCRTKTANTEQSNAGTQTATSQTTSSTEQSSSQTPTINSTTAPLAQNSSTQNSNTTTAASTPGSIDACSLITRAEIESAQGVQVTEARSSTINRTRFNVSQCYYVAAASVKSVSLELTQRAKGQSGAASPREFWEERFEGLIEKKSASVKERVSEMLSIVTVASVRKKRAARQSESQASAMSLLGRQPYCRSALCAQRRCNHQNQHRRAGS